MNAPQKIDFSGITGVSCPCGTARRALTDAAEFPCSVHRTSINKTAKPHYHRRLTEVYYIISCGTDAEMVLGEERFPLHPDLLFYIPPGTVHYLEGEAEVLIVVSPKFDPEDEFFE